MPDFIELAQKSINEYKSSLGSEDVTKYKYTLCVAISQNDEVSCSKDLFILDDAYQCFLIHCCSSLAISNWYNWYEIEFINYKGHNLKDIIGNDCIIKINWEGSWSNQVLKLWHRDDELYTCNPPFECHMQGVWDAYCSTLNKGKDEVASLKAELAQKEEHIQKLEEEVNLYKNALGKIKEIVKELGGE